MLWDSLLVSELRRSIAGDKGARRWREAEKHVAGVEPDALGSRIAEAAVRLRSRWDATACRLRVSCHERERAALLARVSDPVRADSLYQLVVADYRTLGEARREAWVLGGLGVAAFNRSDLEAALLWHGQAYEARRRIGDERMQGNSLEDLGTTLERLNRPLEARERLEASVALRRRAGPAARLPVTLSYLALALDDLGRRDSALVVIAEGMTLASRAGDSVAVRVLLQQRGGAQFHAGDLRAAESSWQRAASAVDALDRDRASIETNLGLVAVQWARYATAIEHFENALGLLVPLPHDAAYARAQLGLGDAWARLGDLQRARPPLDITSDWARSHRDTALAARAAHSLALAHHNSDDPGEADRVLARADSLAARSGSTEIQRDVAALRGAFALDRGDAAGAERAYAQALGLDAGGSARVHGQDRLNRGIARTLRGDLDSAEADFRAVLSGAMAAGDDELVSLAYVDLADVATRRGDDTRALALGREGLHVVERMRANQAGTWAGVRFLAGRADEYESLIHQLVRCARSQRDTTLGVEAFGWAERARARALLDRRTAGDTTWSPLPLSRARAMLQPDELLLAYSVGDSSTTLWQLRAHGWREYSLPARRVLRPLVANLRIHAADRVQAISARTSELADTLGRVLLPADESMWRGVHRLTIVAEDALAILPFEMLRVPGRRAGGAARQWLVEAYDIRYLPSISLPIRTPGAEPTFVAVADPAYSGGNEGPVAAVRAVRPGTALELVPLPGTRREVEALAEAGRALTPHVLTGADASRSQVLAEPALGTARVLHFGVHGESNEVEPDRSALWLAPDSPGDDPSAIEIADVLSLDLHTELVSLAACRSGLGRLERGEGVLSFGRAFLAAGARSVLSSLWKVSDAATAELFSEYYQATLVHGMDRVAALSQVKRRMIHDRRFGSPTNWAAFVLIGADGPLTGP